MKIKIIKYIITLPNFHNTVINSAIPGRRESFLRNRTESREVMTDIRKFSYVSRLSLNENKSTIVQKRHGLFGWLVSERPRQQLGYIADGSQDWRLTVLRLPHTRHSGETMTSVSLSACHIILTATQPVGSGR